MEEEVKVQNPEQLESKEDLSEPIQMILDSVPEQKREVVKSALMVMTELYSGPIPPPRAMKEYETILPGAADRIISMAEKQQMHRMELEKQAITSQSKVTSRGQIFGFIVFIVCILVSILLVAVWNMKTTAAVILTVIIVALVALFLAGRVRLKADLNLKRPEKEE